MEIKVGDILIDRDATPFDLRVVEVAKTHIVVKELTTTPALIKYKKNEYRYLTKGDVMCPICDNTGVDYNAFEMVCKCQRK